jgi:alkylation response protein AidB-like acyl-CoA dehydrogenase
MPTVEEVEAETAEWVDAHWDPALSVGDWWERMAEARLSHPLLPESAYGRGWDRTSMQASRRVMAAKEVVGPPPGLGMTLAAPTLAAHGTPDQIECYVPDIVSGRRAWCQLFSEPGAGSDLAGLQTRAVADGDEWIVNGQKVWTSGGHHAELGMLVARTDPHLPKHQGLTYFALPMLQDGVEVRPLKEMTGRAIFNEVFMSDARVGDDARLGARGDGWRVANTTLTEERASIGAGLSGGPSAFPGGIANHLVRNAGEVVERWRKRERRDGGGVGPGLVRRYFALARELGRVEDPLIRDQLVQLHVLSEVNRLNVARAKAGGRRSGAEGNIAKLHNAELHRRFREVGLALIGADGLLSERSAATGGFVQEIALFSPAPAIYGGTDQVQRNIIGERALGLPKEPGPPKDTPFSELPKNS